MSDAKWPRFEAQVWVVNPLGENQWSLVTTETLGGRRLVCFVPTEPEARELAATLNLAREARELAEAHHDWREAVRAAGKAQAREATRIPEAYHAMHKAREAYRAAKAKETQ